MKMARLEDGKEFWPASGETFCITPQYKLVCCDCGLVHNVELKASFFGRKIIATYTRDNRATIRIREKEYRMQARKELTDANRNILRR